VTAPRRSLLLCSLQRSGSWLLADGLTSTGVAGVPEEYYWHEFREDYLGHWGRPAIGTFADYLTRTFQVGSTPNGVFAAKLHHGELLELCESLRTLPGTAGLDEAALVRAFFPDPRIVHLRRDDTVRQAVSWYRAARTTSWYDVVGEHRRCPDPEPDWARIGLLEQVLREHEQRWHVFFDALGADVLHLVYEDLVEDYEPSVRAVLAHAGIPWPAGLVLPPPRLRRQRDAVTEEWVQQYLVERRRRLLEEASVT
jgi:trehalose 2-sulfotransferase